MGKNTWKPGKHHPIPEGSDFAKENPKLYDATYKNLTIDMSGEEHVQAHRDEREVGPIGSIARYDKRRLQKKP